jgi:fructokinase
MILGIGELLWDLLPAGPRLGGAPANFTAMAARLGNHAAILSRIGRDDFGRKAVDGLGETNAETEFLQVDTVHETGRVTIALKDGQPEYTIHQPAAWDFLSLSDDWVGLAKRADAVCFGSLAQRNLVSKQTIQELISQTRAQCIRIFDVNLRAPFFTGEVIEESLELATVLKMNDAEVPIVLNMLGLGSESETQTDLRVASELLLGEFGQLQLVAITRGNRGSLLVGRSGWHEHAGIAIQVADTIGAGDAFTAALTHYLLRGASLAVLNEAGNRWGAWVASQPGAMPFLSDSVRNTIDEAISSAGQ